MTLLIAWLALQLALGDHEGKASSQGAMQQINEAPGGTFFLWLVALGMFALVLWKLIDAWKGHQEEDDDKKRWAQRGFDVVKAVLYAAIGIAAVRQATGGSSGGSSGKSGTESLTAQIMDLPGGQVLVGLVGFAIIGYGANQIRIAYTDKFRGEDQRGRLLGSVGPGLLLLRQGRLHGQGHRDHHRRRAVRLRGLHAQAPRSPAGSTRRCTPSSSSPSVRSCWASWPSASPATGSSASRGRGTSRADQARYDTASTAASTCSGVVTMLGPSRRYDVA